MMRSYLLGTTALVAVAALATPASAAEPIKLELRGYSQLGLAGIIEEPQYFGLDRQGVDEVFGPVTGVPNASEAFFGNDVVFGSDSEVHFQGMTTFDNGLTVSFRAELELEKDSRVARRADTIDEVYAQVSGVFGRFQLGMQDGVADQMILSAPNVFAQVTISSIDMNPFEMYADPAFNGIGLPGGPFPVSRTRRIMGLSGEFAYLDTSPDFTDDFTKLIYFTPRIYGLQVGVSYTPNPCRNDTGFDVVVRETFACGRSNKFGSNYWEVAANFEQEFPGVVLGLSGSFGQGDANDLNVLLSRKPSEWHLGSNLFFEMGKGKLTIGGAYKGTNGINAENRGFIFAESQQWDAGAKYAIGLWELGGSVGKAKSEYGGPEEALMLVIGGASYKLGPGVKLGLGVIHGKATDGYRGTKFDQSDGTSVFSELDLRF